MFRRALDRPLPPIVGTPLGHLWTIGHHLGRGRKPGELGAIEPFAVTFEDPITGNVTLRGTLHSKATSSTPAPRDLVVLIHGLGGSAQSGYMFEATRAALDLGLAVLRMSLRGADPEGDDFYHAGLWTDVAQILNHDVVKRYDNVYVLGISLGGHVVLRTAGANVPNNVRAVAALCPPLDLGACARAFDRKRQWLFRTHVLDGLKQMYARFAAHHTGTCRELGLPTANDAYAIRTIRQWDQSIVAPRHGFPSADTYYATQSVGPRLGDVHLPALILTTRWDPMVPHHTTVHLLEPVGGNPSMTKTTLEPEARFDTTWRFRRLTKVVQHVELATGGHIAFPQREGPSVFTQTLSWLSLYASR